LGYFWVYYDSQKTTTRSAEEAEKSQDNALSETNKYVLSIFVDESPQQWASLEYGAAQGRIQAESKRFEQTFSLYV
jgi:hypothetical protein